MDKIRVAFLHGGVSNERYLSLRSFENVMGAFVDDPEIEVCGVEWAGAHRWTLTGPAGGEDLSYTSIDELLRENRFDCVYDLFHGQEEGDGHIAAALDLLGVRYIGNCHHASFLGMDKHLTRLVCADRGIPILPAVLLMDKEEPLPADLETTPGFPCMLKPISSGSSIGVQYIENRDRLIAELDLLEASTYPLLLERYCAGKEFCVSTIPDIVRQGMPSLPVVRISYPGRFFDAKTKEEGSYGVSKADIPSAVEGSMRDMATRLHGAIVANVHTRTDFILDASGGIWVLEINTHPGMSQHSIFTNQLEIAGYSLKEYLKRLVMVTVRNPGAISNKIASAAYI